MNVLIYVTSLIMVMSILTYAQIENFFAIRGMQHDFFNYMTLYERSYANTKHKHWYDQTRFSTYESNSSTYVQAKRKISWAPLINPSANLQEAQMIREISKPLIEQLFAEERFLREALEKNPQIIEEFFAALQQAVSELPEEERPKRIQDLKKLELKHPDLNNFFYALGKERKKNSFRNLAFEGENLLNEDADESALVQSEQNDQQCIQGFHSLYDYITLDNSKAIRVFLASPELLMALFKDREVVLNILDTRYQLYRELLVSSSTSSLAAELKARFEADFIQRAPQWQKILNFEVTKTNPRKYE